eukprot:CAMPEP_0177181324 /NCGR_PEP_ID=MMETSP0367-20130122/15864_1 /TAXON_ID=447022 ORGANISM="Scrippsiella hangoei-like, Strain SHHI-4" /NCGR_SAMPLE_ID=MMETSP0367 /ASSEMBLY_ACC=CAM_ASM_000362 /LENGTH=103 /DNA_ID=CAMNT_0018628167 /DNA_START=81 /DNA_END=390 /DNA_ORIENTATION=-
MLVKSQKTLYNRTSTQGWSSLGVNDFQWPTIVSVSPPFENQAQASSLRRYGATATPKRRGASHGRSRARDALLRPTGSPMLSSTKASARAEVRLRPGGDQEVA